MNGYNPMRWNCDSDGCYNLKCRPKIEVFHGCFKGKISMGDVDGIVEINGHILIMEWKSRPGTLPTGQRLLLSRITKISPLITAIIVVGDPEEMRVESVSVCSGGRIHEPEPIDLDGLKSRMKAWAVRAQTRRF